MSTKSSTLQYPELSVKNETRTGRDKTVSSHDVIANFSIGDKIAIEGEDQSGKSSLAYNMVSALREKNLIPVYIHDVEGLLQGNLNSRIAKAFKKEYDTNYDINDFDKSLIIPIIDDFYKVKKAARLLHNLSEYKSSVIIIDGIFRLNFEDDKLLIDRKIYRIKEMKPSLRNELIRKWISLTNVQNREFVNDEFKKLDEKTEWVNRALGKTIGEGIMPAYPFFVLSVISTYETFDKPLEKDITSQGYCYQALIYFFLRKYNVASDDIDTYINFLTEFAYKIYSMHNELSEAEFNNFVKDYSNEFNMTEKKNVMIDKLTKAKIIRISSCHNYSFEYPYLYYFFAGKYFAEHSDRYDESNNKILQEIDQILRNLHTNENAYIAIFLFHHTKSLSLQTNLINNAKDLFKTYSPASLNTDEMRFFSDKELIIKQLNSNDFINNNPNTARKKQLESEDKLSEQENDIDDSPENELSIELRRSIKTVEVIGHIIKNRAGSLKQTELTNLFKEAMFVHLRLLSSFFEIIKTIQNSPESLYSLTENLLNTGTRKIDHNKVIDLTPKIFWNMNFMTIFGLMRKIGLSLGSNKLTNIIENVCDEINTPATFIVKHIILMWNAKNMQISKLYKMKSVTFSQVARDIMKLSIIQYCQMHQIDHIDRNKIIDLLNLKKQDVLPRPTQEK